jgi:hypothetical protein
MKRSNKLPDIMRQYFWQYDFGKLRVERHAAFIISQVLAAYATEEARAWLRLTYGDERIRERIKEIRARGLLFEQVSDWIPREQYDAWERQRPPNLWASR